MLICVVFVRHKEKVRFSTSPHFRTYNLKKAIFKKNQTTFDLKIFYNQIFVVKYVNGQFLSDKMRLHSLRRRLPLWEWYYHFLCHAFPICILLHILLYIQHIYSLDDVVNGVILFSVLYFTCMWSYYVYRCAWVCLETLGRSFDSTCTTIYSYLITFYNCAIKEIDFDWKGVPNVQTDIQLK